MTIELCRFRTCHCNFCQDNATTARRWCLPGYERVTMASNVFTGTIPALMTPCTPRRAPNLRALVRKARELVGVGMSAVVYCGSMGDWPLLSDEQRKQGVERLVQAGVAVIVGTGAHAPGGVEARAQREGER